MKKLLATLSSLTLIVSGSSSVMAMSPNNQLEKPENKKINQIPINDLKIIEVPKTASVVVGAITQVIIQNFSDLTNVKAQSMDTQFVTASLFDNLIELRGLSQGTTTVKVTADDAEDAFITVTIVNLKEIDVDKNAEIYVARTSSLPIRNASELTGLNAQSVNDEVVTASIVNNSVEIVGISEGTTTVIVTADDAENAVITVTVENLKPIDLDRNEATIIVGNTTNFKINNFQDLKEVKVTSENSKIASATLISDLIIVKGIGNGTVNVVVSAFNAENEIISITVNDLMPIEVDKEVVEIYGNNSEQVKITNFSDLDDVDVNSDNDSIASAVIDSEGVITIYGNQVGTTVIFINAKDAGQKTISVTVKELKTIDVDKTTEVYANETTKLQIRNASELTAIEVKSANEQIATALVENNSTIVISGLSAGQTEITVSAANAQEAKIAVIVNDLKTITINREATVVINKPVYLPIANFNDLKNVEVKSANPNIAAVGLDQDSVVILGMTEGTVEVTVSAFRAWDAIISVTVSPLKAIEVDKSQVDVDETYSAEVKIINFDSLNAVAVKSKNTWVARATIDNQGVISIQGINAGLTIITITAENAIEKEIQVTVNQLGKIIVDKETVDIYGEQTELVEITNYSNLTNVNVHSNNEEVVTVINHQNGVISIVRTFGSNIGDQTTIEITADHATRTIIPVTIKAETPLTNIIKTLALDSEEEEQVIDEIVRRNYDSGLTKEDIKIKEGSFKAPNSEELKLGEVIIESNNPKYGGEIKLLLVPQLPNDPKTEELMLKIKNGKDLEERKPYWEEYFKYKGIVFFDQFMPKNPWSFKEDEFEIDENGDKQIKPEAFDLISAYLHAVTKNLLEKDYNKYDIKKDYSISDYFVSNYQTTVQDQFVVIYFSGFYQFKLTDNSTLKIDFAGSIGGTITD